MVVNRSSTHRAPNKTIQTRKNSPLYEDFARTENSASETLKRTNHLILNAENIKASLHHCQHVLQSTSFSTQLKGRWIKFSYQSNFPTWSSYRQLERSIRDTRKTRILAKFKKSIRIFIFAPEVVPAPVNGETQPVNSGTRRKRDSVLK